MIFEMACMMHFFPNQNAYKCTDIFNGGYSKSLKRKYTVIVLPASMLPPYFQIDKAWVAVINSKDIPDGSCIVAMHDEKPYVA